MPSRRRAVLLLGLTLTSLGDLTGAASAQRSESLDSVIVSENRTLDRQLLEAHERRDTDMVMSLFSKSPDTFFITPTGAVIKGPGNIRESFVRFFAGLQAIHAEITDVIYVPAGDGLIAVGTVIFHRKLQNGTSDDRTVVWTDFRRKEQGRWVFLFRHAHWPVSAGK